MSFLDKVRRFLKSNEDLEAAKRLHTHKEPLHDWDGRREIYDLTGAKDWLTLQDFSPGIGVFGQAGSGKTSSMLPFASWLMELNIPFTWMCNKPGEVHLAYATAKSAGREKDVVIIGENTQGVFTHHSFNPLDYECNRPTATTKSVANYLSACDRILSRKDGEDSGGSTDRYWNDQFERLLEYCIDTIKLSGGEINIDSLRNIQLSAPQNIEQLFDDGWMQTSACSQCLIKAGERYKNKEILKPALDRIVNFWTADYAKLDLEPRGILDGMFARLIDAFNSDMRIRSVLCSKSTVTPDDCIDGQKIVILSLPTSRWHEAGRMAQYCFKYSYQRSMLARMPKEDGTPMSPSVLWVDEAHSFVHHFDSTYLREVRSNRGITVFLDQGIGGYYQALNFNSPVQIDDLLQNLTIKIFFQNNSSETNKYAADAIGKFLLDKNSESHSHSTGHHSTGDSTTQEEQYAVLPGQFTVLERDKINGIVEAYVLKSDPFNTNDKKYELCAFRQSELTK